MNWLRGLGIHLDGAGGAYLGIGSLFFQIFNGKFLTLEQTKEHSRLGPHLTPPCTEPVEVYFSSALLHILTTSQNIRLQLQHTSI